MSIGSVSSSSLYGSPFQRMNIGQNAGQPGQSSPMDQIKKIDSQLAGKLQGFKNQAAQMQKSGASTDQIKQAMQSDFQSLSPTLQSEMKRVFGARSGAHHRPMGTPPGGTSIGMNPQAGPPSTGGSLASTLLGSQPAVQNSALSQLLSAQSPTQAAGQDKDGDGDGK